MIASDHWLPYKIVGLLALYDCIYIYSYIYNIIVLDPYNLYKLSTHVVCYTISMKITLELPSRTWQVNRIGQKFQACIKCTKSIL